MTVAMWNYLQPSPAPFAVSEDLLLEPTIPTIVVLPADDCCPCLMLMLPFLILFAFCKLRQKEVIANVSSPEQKV